MTTEELIERAENSIAENRSLTISTEELVGVTPEQAELLQKKFGSRLLMHMPEHEIAFQEWLKVNDHVVWKDLWDDQEDPPYTISLAFLPDMIGKPNEGAFFICDLQNTDNYFFTPDMLLDKESTDFVSAVRDRFVGGRTLSPEQALTVEISAGPTDIWHFAYRRGVDLERAKKAVAALVEDRIIVHVPKADHLSTHFDVG
ncbi:MAG: hypothetical protein IPI24_06770 [Ignavibacteria bacterium]|nr:hypothetical protein [Ignavibacteria bacterium]MBK9182812.1 hypothetical protein [Ignavibacteria bacterium]